MDNSKYPAFTLPELAVALTILGILAVLVVPRAASFLVQARRGEAKVNLEHIKSLQAVYRVENGSPSYGWLVGYKGTGADNCDAEDAGELANPLGFTPKGCPKLRYSYYVEKNGSNYTYYAWGASDKEGKWIYPDCEGGHTVSECKADSGDKLMASDIGAVEVCRDIVKYCPGGGTGSNTFPTISKTCSNPPSSVTDTKCPAGQRYRRNLHNIILSSATSNSLFTSSCCERIEHRNCDSPPSGVSKSCPSGKIHEENPLQISLLDNADQQDYHVKCCKDNPPGESPIDPCPSPPCETGEEKTVEPPPVNNKTCNSYAVGKGWGTNSKNNICAERGSDYVYDSNRSGNIVFPKANWKWKIICCKKELKTCDTYATKKGFGTLELKKDKCDEDSKVFVSGRGNQRVFPETDRKWKGVCCRRAKTCNSFAAGKLWGTTRKNNECSPRVFNESKKDSPVVPEDVPTWKSVCCRSSKTCDSYASANYFGSLDQKMVKCASMRPPKIFNRNRGGNPVNPETLAEWKDVCCIAPKKCKDVPVNQRSCPAYANWTNDNNRIGETAAQCCFCDNGIQAPTGGCTCDDIMDASNKRCTGGNAHKTWDGDAIGATQADCCKCYGAEKAIRLQGGTVIEYCCKNTPLPSCPQIDGSDWTIRDYSGGTRPKSSECVCSEAPKCSSVTPPTKDGRDKDGSKSDHTYHDKTGKKDYCYCDADTPKWDGSSCVATCASSLGVNNQHQVARDTECTNAVGVTSPWRSNNLPVTNANCCTTQHNCSNPPNAITMTRRDCDPWKTFDGDKPLASTATNTDFKDTCCECKSGVTYQVGQTRQTRCCATFLPNEQSFKPTKCPASRTTVSSNQKAARCTCRPEPTTTCLSFSTANTGTKDVLCGVGSSYKQPETATDVLTLTDDTSDKYKDTCCRKDKCSDLGTDKVRKDSNGNDVTVDRKEDTTTLAIEYGSNENQCYCGVSAPNWDGSSCVADIPPCEGYFNDRKVDFTPPPANEEALCQRLYGTQGPGYTGQADSGNGAIADDDDYKSRCCRVQTCEEYYTKQTAGQLTRTTKPAFCGTGLSPTGDWSATDLNFSSTTQLASDAFKNTCCTTVDGCSGTERTDEDCNNVCCESGQGADASIVCNIDAGIWESTSSRGQTPEVSCSCRPYTCVNPPPVTPNTANDCNNDYPRCQGTHKVTDVDGTAIRQTRYSLSQPITGATFRTSCCIPKGCDELSTPELKCRSLNISQTTVTTWDATRTPQCQCVDTGKTFNATTCTCEDRAVSTACTDSTLTLEQKCNHSDVGSIAQWDANTRKCNCTDTTKTFKADTCTCETGYLQCKDNITCTGTASNDSSRTVDHRGGISSTITYRSNQNHETHCCCTPDEPIWDSGTCKPLPNKCVDNKPATPTPNPCPTPTVKKWTEDTNALGTDATACCIVKNCNEWRTDDDTGVIKTSDQACGENLVFLNGGNQIPPGKLNSPTTFCCSGECKKVDATTGERKACEDHNNCSWSTNSLRSAGCATCDIYPKVWNWSGGVGSCICPTNENCERPNNHCSIKDVGNKMCQTVCDSAANGEPRSWNGADKCVCNIQDGGGDDDIDCRDDSIHAGDDDGIGFDQTTCACKCISGYTNKGTNSKPFCCPTGEIKHPTENRCCVEDTANEGQCAPATPVQPLACCYLRGLGFSEGGLRSQLLNNCCNGDKGKTRGLSDETCSGLHSMSYTLGITNTECGNVGDHELVWRAYKEALEKTDSSCRGTRAPQNITDSSQADLVDAVKDGSDACGSLGRGSTPCSPVGGAACPSP